MHMARVLTVLVLSASLGACALIPHQRHLTKITPVSTPAPATEQRPADGLYADAVKAINARDYADALDDLEAARQHDGSDVRVLNAFGVVYDKLGRFDLSTRYYGQAAALDPSSEIVTHNLAYSELLQRRAQREAGPRLAAAAPGPAPSRAIVQIAPGVARLQTPIGLAPVIALPRGLAGRPLMLVDASGGHSAEPLRLELARLGWTPPRTTERSKAVVAGSRIVFSPEARVVALALARTLPRRVALVACANGCAGVRLILGTDSLSWNNRARRDIGRRV
jgi:hypothetical protein